MEKIRLLMIDDNVSLIEMVEEYFKGHNKIEVSLTAHDGAEGIQVIEEKKDLYDLIILDLIMPNKDGMYVLEEMKNRGIDKKSNCCY